VTEVRIGNKRARDVYGILDSLTAQGLTQGNDYDYAYCPSWAFNNTTSRPKAYESGHITIKFYDEKHASWFNLTRK
jgi:hypothetical protein